MSSSSGVATRLVQNCQGGPGSTTGWTKVRKGPDFFSLGPFPVVLSLGCRAKVRGEPPLVSWLENSVVSGGKKRPSAPACAVPWPRRSQGMTQGGGEFTSLLEHLLRGDAFEQCGAQG